MFNSFYHGKRVLVTGHTGFKGSWLSMWLKRLGASVIGVSDRVPTDPSLFVATDLESQIDHRIADVRDLNSIAEIIAETTPDVVFHLAAQALVFDAYENP
ncbi:MAG: NAD-dependent epimerase/dehydratase family protein, partial [Planctomycetota bacterium]